MANCVIALASEKLFKAVLVIVRFIEKTEPIPLLSGSDANAVVAGDGGMGNDGHQHLRTNSALNHALQTLQKAGENISKH